MLCDVQTIEPGACLQEAAQLMDRLNIGFLPVCDGKRLLGMVTDRDITVRGTAAGLAPKTGCVSEVMSGDLQWVTEDQDSEEAWRSMRTSHVKCLPVINARKELVGLVALRDVANRKADLHDTAVHEVSAGSEPDRGPRSA
jgi:CBS domain-containing protein